jgi:tRNA pseudouridine38-40 synthase
MPRYRLTIEYDGTPFRGWQSQSNLPSVQAAVEGAVLRSAGEAVTVVAAGRTDSGVHALGQVAHLDLARDWRPERLAGALNQHLKPLPVAVLDARRVPDDFHARFSAVRRSYVYRILNRRAPPALGRDRCWHVPVRLEHEHMREAAQALVGRHDFTSFRSAECQAPSPVRTLDLIHVAPRTDDPEVIEVRLAARSFLHHQVRNIVGTLRLVGEGKVGTGHIREVLAARDRGAAGATAPAAGLFLATVAYGGR